MRAVCSFFTLLNIVWEATCSIQVKGFVGGSLLIKCKFSKSYGHKTIYFCRDQDKCPYQRSDYAREHRYREFNFRTEHLYTVFIRQLAMTDAGEYRCAVENEEAYIKVTLNIKEDNCCPQPEEVTGLVGEDISIFCKYPQESKDNIKYFCKQENVFNCSNLIAEKGSTSSRFSVNDDKKQSVFTVRISNVSSRDSGVYWCGVRTGANTGSVALLTEVSLRVQDPDKTTQHLSRNDSFLITGVSLTLAVVILGITVFIFLKCKHNSTSRPVSSSDHTTKPSKDTSQDYEEIGPRPFTAHRTRLQDEDRPAGLRSAPDPSDGLNYATVQFHRNPEKNTRCTTASPQTDLQTEDAVYEYATVKHPTQE